MNTRKKNKVEIDMVNGPMVKKMILFTVPIMLSGILQLLFNAADMVVVGRFAGEEALAAVGSTSSLTNLLINLFIGLSVGANVITAFFIGAKEDIKANQVVHTAIMTSLLSGFFLAVAGFFLSRPLLEMMGTDPAVIDLAVLYMRIYFAGMPVVMIYNFGSAILRAIGDTKRPLYFLLTAGICNLILNLYFVIGLHMSVAGVALATIISQALSAILVLIWLGKLEGPCKLSMRKLKIHKDILLRMMRIGLPAGVQGCLFSFSNVLIQSSINLFGAAAMAGSAASASVEGFVYTSMNAFHQTALNFTGQNVGAEKYDRVPKIFGRCFAMVTIIGIVAGGVTYLFGRELLGIYSDSQEVVDYGMIRLTIIILPYFLCGQMEVVVGVLRGMGYAIMPMIVSLLGACGLRIVWIVTVFQMNKTLETLYLSYPVSWLITTLVHCICFAVIFKKYKKHQEKA